MPITHAKVSGKSDGGDSSQVQPSDWNADHVGGGAAFEAHDRPPADPVNAKWNLSISDTPDGGTFTLLISVDGGAPLETDPIAWNAPNYDDPNPSVFSALEATLGVGTVSAIDGPLPAIIEIEFIGSLTHTPVVIAAGDNSITGSDTPEPILDQLVVGTAGDLGYAEGSGWWDDDGQKAFVNNGNETTPAWIQLGDVYDQQPGGLTIGGSFVARGVSVTPLSLGGSGLYSDEHNVPGTDGSAGAAIIAGATDPSSGGGYSPDYVQGSLFLFNPDDAGARRGRLYLKTGTAQGEWGNIGVVLDKVGILAIGNDDTEQTLYSFLLPGGSLGTSGAIRLSMRGNYLQNSGGNKTFTLRVKYGTTTLFGDVSANISSDANRHAWRADLILLAYGATNAQRLNGQIAMGSVSAGSVAGFGNLGGSDTIPLSLLAGESAEDSTGDLPYSVTIQHSAADANLEIVRAFAWLEQLSA